MLLVQLTLVGVGGLSVLAIVLEVLSGLVDPCHFTLQQVKVANVGRVQLLESVVVSVTADGRDHLSRLLHVMDNTLVLHVFNWLVKQVVGHCI